MEPTDQLDASNRRLPESREGGLLIVDQLSAIVVFPSKSKRFNHFLDPAFWLLFAPEVQSWELPRTNSGPVSSLISRGGMGEVYRAKDTRLNRLVTIKVLPADVTDTPCVATTFEREARLVSTLSHQNICPLFDVEEHDGGRATTRTARRSPRAT